MKKKNAGQISLWTPARKCDGIIEESFDSLYEAGESAQTPYERHAALNHTMTRYSPNGVDTIEECECGARFLHNPSFGYPLTLLASDSGKPVIAQLCPRCGELESSCDCAEDSEAHRKSEDPRPSDIDERERAPYGRPTNYGRNIKGFQI